MSSGNTFTQGKPGFRRNNILFSQLITLIYYRCQFFFVVMNINQARIFLTILIQSHVHLFSVYRIRRCIDIKSRAQTQHVFMRNLFLINRERDKIKVSKLLESLLRNLCNTKRHAVSNTRVNIVTWHSKILNIYFHKLSFRSSSNFHI